MPIRDQNHRRVAVSVAPAVVRRLHEAPDFLDSKVFAWPTCAVRSQARRHCPVIGVRCPPPLRRFHKENYSIKRRYCPVLGSFRDSRTYHILCPSFLSPRPCYGRVGLSHSRFASVGIIATSHQPARHFLMCDLPATLIP